MVAPPAPVWVPVAGGELAVEVVPGSTAPVLAVHGISSQRRLWDWLRVEAPELSLVAPDLRGRGDSIHVSGASDLDRHVEDLVTVLDYLQLPEAHVVGMSMGGFVGVRLAARYPQRVTSLVLVDGGFPMVTPPGLTREALPTLFADRLGRLQQQWASLDDYLAFFTSTTAPLCDPADPVLREYLAHDLVDGRVRLSGDALVSDAADVYFSEDPWDRLEVPVRFVHAEWSTGPDTPPAYSAERVAEYAQHCTSVELVPGTDHATSIMSPAGAAATARAVRAALVAVPA